jgi:hypothetical protein
MISGGKWFSDGAISKRIELVIESASRFNGEKRKMPHL